MANNDLSLYGITDELSALEQILESEAGELSDEWVQMLNEITPILEHKVDGCVGFYNKEKDLIKLAREKARELQEYAR
ncbi:MAG: hypothetical protein IID18_03520, partial [Nitrospinae bacterium]|nr:hypothetical protein [Nitrospinota bacterium]